MSKDESCPICEQIGGYCGGSGHPSCGAFINGRPVSENELLAAQTTKEQVDKAQADKA